MSANKKKLRRLNGEASSDCSENTVRPGAITHRDALERPWLPDSDNRRPVHVSVLDCGSLGATAVSRAAAVAATVPTTVSAAEQAAMSSATVPVARIAARVAAAVAAAIEQPSQAGIGAALAKHEYHGKRQHAQHHSKQLIPIHHQTLHSIKGGLDRKPKLGPSLLLQNALPQ